MLQNPVLLFRFQLFFVVFVSFWDVGRVQNWNFIVFFLLIFCLFVNDVFDMHDRVVVELAETLEKSFVDLYVVLLSVKFIDVFFF